MFSWILGYTISVVTIWKIPSLVWVCRVVERGRGKMRVTDEFWCFRSLNSDLNFLMNLGQLSIAIWELATVLAGDLAKASKAVGSYWWFKEISGWIKLTLSLCPKQILPLLACLSLHLTSTKGLCTSVQVLCATLGSGKTCLRLTTKLHSS